MESDILVLWSPVVLAPLSPRWGKIQVASRIFAFEPLKKQSLSGSEPILLFAQQIMTFLNKKPTRGAYFVPLIYDSRFAVWHLAVESGNIEFI